MVGRTAPEMMKLTQANHPENAIPEAPKAPSTLGPTICACIVSGLVGMTFGCAALSTAFLVDARWHVASLLPLVIGGVCILGAWIGAFAWMCGDGAEQEP